MGDRFDQLAKDAAADLPRREAFRRIGGGLLGVVLASLGLAAAKDNDQCGKACAVCCNLRDFPPRSAEHAQCIRDCHAGVGGDGTCAAFVRGPGGGC